VEEAYKELLSICLVEATKRVMAGRGSEVPDIRIKSVNNEHVNILSYG
jgi:hypothetical protein